MVKKYLTDKEILSEFQPDSRKRVLKNKLGITSRKEIDKKEYESLLKTQEHYYKVISKDTTFTIRDAYLDALLTGYAGNYIPLAEIIKAAIERSVKKLTR